MHFRTALPVSLGGWPETTGRFFQPVVQAMSGLEFKELLGSTDIKASARPGIYVLAMAMNGFRIRR
jgi:hypothetical protein